MISDSEGPLVVIVAYGSEDLLRSCLASLAAPAGSVLVIDNGSSATASGMAKESGADYLDPGTNLGYAAAVNLGINRRAGRDVLLLNPDATITWPDVLALATVQGHWAAASPRLEDPDGTEQRVWWPVPSPAVAWASVVGLADRAPGPRFLAGPALLLRARALEVLGGFDERFFLYAEESDWQLRALRAGWQLRLEPSLVVTHVSGASSSDESLRLKHFHTSYRLFAQKWYGSSGWRTMRVAGVLAALRRGDRATARMYR